MTIGERPPNTTVVGVALLAKAPVPGSVKTRFVPPCSLKQAAVFARAFLQDTADMLASPGIAARIQTWCSYLGDATLLQEIFGTQLLEQHGDDFGARIANATEDLFDNGCGAVVALCADCPTVDADYFGEALDLLVDHDVVFGPANDGGCLFVGLSQRAPKLFSEVEMSTDHVYDDMLEIAKNYGFSIATMAFRYDLDRFRDLEDAMRAGELDHARHTLGAHENIGSTL